MSKELFKVLVVDDERSMRRSLGILLSEEGPYDVRCAEDYYEAIKEVDRGVDVVLTDLSMPGKSGLDLLRTLREGDNDVPVILMTAHSTVESAVIALKEGASDYLIKPFENAHLLRCLRKALGENGLHASHGEDGEPKKRFGDILGKAPSMQRLYQSIERAATIGSTVLINGESGTGKELVARAIHFSGDRKDRPFVAINCAAIPDQLLESELFGHEKGAFSGALRRHAGKFEQADGGTIFLDEVAEMHISLQAKLLRVLQEKSFDPVGGSQTHVVDVRIIAATHRDLLTLVSSDRFREDLFFRLNVLTIDIPPLRERLEDLDLLTTHFLRQKCQRLGVETKELSESSKRFLRSYDFPGNVRELENLIERAIVMTPEKFIELDRIGTAPLDVQDEGAIANTIGDIPLELGMKLLDRQHQRREKQLIEKALEEFPEKSNSEIADILGTSRRVLENRIKQYGLKKP